MEEGGRTRRIVASLEALLEHTDSSRRDIVLVFAEGTEVVEGMVETVAEIVVCRRKTNLMVG